MGRLNSLIKFLVINANGFLTLAGLGTIVVASIALASNFINLAEVCAKTNNPNYFCSEEFRSRVVVPGSVEVMIADMKALSVSASLPTT